jgi:hypothetical protein
MVGGNDCGLLSVSISTNIKTCPESSQSESKSSSSFTQQSSETSLPHDKPLDDVSNDAFRLALAPEPLVLPSLPSDLIPASSTSLFLSPNDPTYQMFAEDSHFQPSRDPYLSKLSFHRRYLQLPHPTDLSGQHFPNFQLSRSFRADLDHQLSPRFQSVHVQPLRNVQSNFNVWPSHNFLSDRQFNNFQSGHNDIAQSFIQSDVCLTN